ncbi:MAG: nucleotidyltransferase [Clostridia bacterium]|nr:nucleotidyltransferase [Clostridia bacterium]
MKVLGLIVEYNPFHNGHLYHLEESKKLSGADYTVCVMSGNFIQRGEPALVNKWARAKMAILSGVDLVIELPTAFAMASAEYFAYGAVKILDSLGIVNYLCFGSESGSIHELDLIANVLYNEPQEYKSFLKESLKKGISYPAAREEALISYLYKKNIYSDRLDLTLKSSNNILGIEYLKAIKSLKSNIRPLTLKRIGNRYNDMELTGRISSATSIRKLIHDSSKENQSLNSLENVLPIYSQAILENEFSNGKGPVFSASFENILLSSLRKMSKEQIRELPYVSEGLENRIKSAVESSGSYEELVEQISTKRYPRTRVQRTVFNILTGITLRKLNTFLAYGGPQYLRVLGFNPRGMKLLSQIKKTAVLPVMVKPSDYKNSCNPLLKEMFEMEVQATDVYVLGYSNPAFKKSGQEFTENIVIIR